jgi:ubiquinone/menaquinone biosynthesis C-methylase UbiE
MRMPRKYSSEPRDRDAFTRSHDRQYTRFAGIYDLAVKRLPVWRTWLRRALPHLVGPRVLEVSFGTGYLLTHYARDYQAFGIDYNWTMVNTARDNLRSAGTRAHLQQASVEALPYRDAVFDTVVNTMAFSGYPDAARALGEMGRVLSPEGRLVLIDIGYPQNGNWIGTLLADSWKLSGDLIREMHGLFDRHGFDHTDVEIGGMGSVHLYVATRRA